MKLRGNFRTLLVAVICGLGALCGGQEVASTATQVARDDSLNVASTTGTVFRIGCLRQDPDSKITAEVGQRLASYLNHNPKVIAAMQAEGVVEIQAQSFEAHRWLMEAMDAEQLDMAFCSSIDFIYQKGRYAAAFQLRLPHDRPGRDRLNYYGAIFVNSRSPLFALPPADWQARLPNYFATHDLALVGPNSAAGYIYPILKISELTSGTVFPRGQFWGSSEEVVKAVINGSAEIGACDVAVIESVLRESGFDARKGELVRELRRTEPIPRDPVVFLQKWSPQVSRLGRAVREASQAFFNEQSASAPRLQVSSDEKQFRYLRRAINEFNQLRKQHGQ